MTRRALYDALDGEAYGKAMTAIILLSLVPLCFHEDHLPLVVLDYACCAVFVVDYAARLATADLKLGRGAASFAIYPFTPMAVVDLLSILPTFMGINPAFRALRVLRLLRALRAFRLLRYSRSVGALVRAVESQRDKLLAVLAFAAMYVLVSALVVFNVEPDTFTDFLDAVYWAVVSLTTVGYGDIYPQSDAGRMVAMASSVMGIAVVAMPASIITAGLLDELGDGNGQ